MRRAHLLPAPGMQVSARLGWLDGGITHVTHYHLARYLPTVKDQCLPHIVSDFFLIFGPSTLLCTQYCCPRSLRHGEALATDANRAAAAANLREAVEDMLQML